MIARVSCTPNSSAGKIYCDGDFRKLRPNCLMLDDSFSTLHPDLSVFDSGFVGCSADSQVDCLVKDASGLNRGQQGGQIGLAGIDQVVARNVAICKRYLSSDTMAPQPQFCFWIN